MINVNTKSFKVGSHLLFEGEDYSVYVLVEPCGAKKLNIPGHSHKDWDESWYIIDGKYEIKIGDKTINAYEGFFVEVDRKVVHSVKSMSGNSKRLAIFKKGVEIIHE